MPLSHRYADKEDLPHVFVLYLQALEEIGEEFIESKVFDFMLKCWSMAPCVLLIEDEEIIGFCGLLTATKPYSDQTFLKDYMFFIKPRKRSLRALLCLCNAAKDTADKFGLPIRVEHRFTGSLARHERFVRMAKAKIHSINVIYGDFNG